jgi:hypothetical protein
MTDPAYPYWRRELAGGAVTLTLTTEQASALRAELAAALGEAPTFYPRLDDLAFRLAFDADYLRLRDVEAGR